MPSLSSTCLRYSTARVSLPGGLLVSMRTSAWKCCRVSVSTAFQSIGGCARAVPVTAADSRTVRIRIGLMMNGLGLSALDGHDLRAGQAGGVETLTSGIRTFARSERPDDHLLPPRGDSSPDRQSRRLDLLLHRRSP